MTHFHFFCCFTLRTQNTQLLPFSFSVFITTIAVIIRVSSDSLSIFLCSCIENKDKLYSANCSYRFDLKVHLIHLSATIHKKLLVLLVSLFWCSFYFYSKIIITTFAPMYSNRCLPFEKKKSVPLCVSFQAFFFLVFMKTFFQNFYSTRKLHQNQIKFRILPFNLIISTQNVGKMEWNKTTKTITFHMHSPFASFLTHYGRNAFWNVLKW